jgi:hypothetical protein
MNSLRHRLAGRAPPSLRAAALGRAPVLFVAQPRAIRCGLECSGLFRVAACNRYGPSIVSTRPYSSGGMPTLTVDMALSVTNATHTQMDRGLQGQALEQIAASTGQPLSDRWHGMLNIFMTTTVNNIVPLGFAADQVGIQAYNQQFSALLSAGNEDTKQLMELNRSIWETMLTKAFNAKMVRDPPSAFAWLGPGMCYAGLTGRVWWAAPGRADPAVDSTRGAGQDFGPPPLPRFFVARGQGR